MEEVFINSLVKNGKFFLTVNGSAKVFQDTELSAIIFNTVFDSIINTMCISSNGKFLLICLQSGTIHIFYMEGATDITCIFRK